LMSDWQEALYIFIKPVPKIMSLIPGYVGLTTC